MSFTSTSSRAWLHSIAETSPSTKTGPSWSTTSAEPAPPAAAIRSPVSSIVSGLPISEGPDARLLRPVAQTYKPARASSTAIARPAPRVAPATNATLIARKLCPRQPRPTRRPLSPEPLDRRVGAPPVGGCLRHARAVARRRLRHRVVHLRARARAGHQDHARPVARTHEGVLGPRGGVEEVPRPEAPLLALDDQRALAREHQERLLVHLGVVEARLSGFQHGEVDPQLGKLDRRVAVLVLEGAPRAPRLGRPPLGVAHVDDEPALGDRRKPR